MKSETGLVLRLAGPLLQVACLILLFASRGRAWSVAGTPVETLAYAGFALGLLLVAAGLALTGLAAKPPRDGEAGRAGRRDRP